MMMNESKDSSSSIDTSPAAIDGSRESKASDTNDGQRQTSAAAAADEAPSQSSHSSSSLASVASSTSTQWPSPLSQEESSPSQDVTNLQGILDRALHDPFSTHPDVTAHLKSNIDSHCRLAAAKIHEADVLLVVTGAGFSADSGLATYVDVADIDAYRDRGWRYRDLCKPPAFTDFSSLNIVSDDGDDGANEGLDVEEKGGDNGTIDINIKPVEARQKSSVENGDTMEVNGEIERKSDSDSAISVEGNNDCHRELYFKEHGNNSTGKNPAELPDEDDIEHPQYFYGFWGQCCNDYRRVKPHDGYDIIKRWGKDKNFVTTKGKNTELSSEIEESSIVQQPQSSEGISSKAAQEIRKITNILEQGDSADSDSSDGSECFNFKKDDESEPYYVSPNKRAGAFFLFTSNVDAHSFDVFKSHEIRECHGNVEIWQCHNFACGTNNTVANGGSLDDSFDRDNDPSTDAVDNEKQQPGRRLWRLPMDHHFSVDRNTMCAPYSKTSNAAAQATGRSASFGSSSPSHHPPASKRRKSSMQEDDDNGSTASCDEDARGVVYAEKKDNDNAVADACADDGEAPDTAAALGGIMEYTLRTHLEKEGEKNSSSKSDPPPGKLQGGEAAHVGDVHGKPRLFPLRHMHSPSTTAETTNTVSCYNLPISTTDNWPRCPRCKEAARPAVLMFEDLDWVYNLKQEKRWQRWCQSLLKMCKQRSRGTASLDSDSASTSSDTNMSESGWVDVPAPSEEQSNDNSEEVIAPVASDEPKNAATEQPAPNPEPPNNDQPALKVTILEIGCGYNVPTCRVVAERLVGELAMRGGDASLIRINPSHPEPDDQDVEEHVISIMEKGLDALKLIDGHYNELVRSSD